MEEEAPWGKSGEQKIEKESTSEIKRERKKEEEPSQIKEMVPISGGWFTDRYNLVSVFLLLVSLVE